MMEDDIKELFEPVNLGVFLLGQAVIILKSVSERS